LPDALATVRMRNRAGQGIGGIRARFGRQGQQALHHVLHLHLVGVTVADHCLFNLQGGVLGDFEATDDQRGDRRATRLAEAQRRLWIDIDEDNFDGCLVGLVAGDQRQQFGVYRPQAAGQRGAGIGLDAAAGQIGQPVAVFFRSARNR
jgi:hypothetical protein